VLLHSPAAAQPARVAEARQLQQRASAPRERDEARRQAADAITNYTLMEAKCFRLENHDQFKS
jgi:hypothetical protein